MISKIDKDRQFTECTGVKWTDQCRQHFIEKNTIEHHYPWENPTDPKIRQLGSMVRNVMRVFDVPLEKHYRSQKCCSDVHNIASSKKLNGMFPLEISEGHTRDI